MVTDELRSKWSAWRGAAWWPAALLVLVQTANGMWYMPQLSFFPIYLQEQLGLGPVAIAAMVAGAQVAGMLTAVVGGAVTGTLGSNWTLVCGLALSALGTLAFQVHAAWLAAMLWFAGGAGLALITVGGASYLTRLSSGAPRAPAQSARAAGQAARAGRDSDKNSPDVALGMLAAVYALSMTVGGSIGNPIAGTLIDRRGFSAFGLAETALIIITALVAARFMVYLGDRSAQTTSLRAFWAGALPMARRARVRQLLGLRSLPTIFYGMLTVLIPLLLNELSGSKATVAAYSTTNLIVASGAQLLAGRAADHWGARRPTLAAYGCVVIAGFGLAATADTVWGLFVFGVLGVAAAWSLSTLMYVWVANGIPTDEHASSFGLLHAVWSLSMITGTLLGGWLVRAIPGLPFLVAGGLNVGSLFLTLAYYRQLIPAAGSAARELEAE